MMWTLQMGDKCGGLSLLLVILWAVLRQYSSLFEQKRWGQSRCEQKWVGSHPLSSGEGQTPPTALLAALPNVAFAQNPCKHSHRNRNVHVRGSLIVAVFLFSLCSLNVHGELAMHFFTSSRPLYFFFPPLFPFSLIVILSAFVSGWLFLLPSSFYSHFLTPAPIPPSLPLVFYLTSPLPVVLVGALVCHEGDGSWLVVGGLNGHLILALPHIVGMCNLFKIRFPRWVLSLAMVSTIMRVYTVVLLSLPLSLCLLCLAMTLLYMNLQFFPSLLGKKAAIVPKACKPWQPLMLVNRWQSNVKPHWRKHTLSEKTDR